METIEVESQRLGVTRRITVWLPPGFKTRGARYPVLYLNDGQNVFDPSRAFGGVAWNAGEAAKGLIRRGRIPPLLVIAIDHGDARRAREYLPVEDDRNPDAKRPLGARYAAFVTREVMPAIARRYPVAHGARNTGFGGSSYGAVAALHTALTHPGVFGRLLIESPSLYVGNGYLLRKARTAGRWPSRVYLGVGTKETRDREWNEETVANVLALERILRTAGMGPRRLHVRVDEGATHSEGAWAARLPEALEFLFG